jgi:hypothetical protein
VTTTFEAARLLLTDSSNIWKNVNVDGKKLPANEWIGGPAAKSVDDIWQANVTMTFALPSTGEKATLKFVPFVERKHARTGLGLRPASESLELFKTLAADATKTNRKVIAGVSIVVTPA